MYIGGWILIIIGALFLLQNLGIITGIQWSVVWPVFIILIGIFALTRAKNRSSFRDAFRHHVMSHPESGATTNSTGEKSSL